MIVILIFKTTIKTLSWKSSLPNQTELGSFSAFDGFGPIALFGFGVKGQSSPAFLGHDGLIFSSRPHAVHVVAAVVGVGTDFAVDGAFANAHLWWH